MENTSELLVYQKVRDHLETVIRTHPAGRKLPTERALSEQLRVNRGTVRRAIAELEQEGFVSRQQGRGTFIRRGESGERPAAARQRATVSLVLGSLEVPFHLELLRGVEREASASGYALGLRQCNLDPERERRMIEEFADAPPDGVLLCAINPNPRDPAYAAAVNRLLDAGCKVVVMDQVVSGCAARVAMVDKVKVGYLPTEQLIVAGHRRICYLSTHTFDPSGDESYRGYRQALADYGVPFDPALEINLSSNFCAEPARERIRERLEADSGYCSAVVTNAFSMAFGVKNALADLGLEPSREAMPGKGVVLVGNNLGWNPELSDLPHTLQDYEETGGAAMRLLTEELEGRAAEGPRHKLIAPRLIWPEAGFPAPSAEGRLDAESSLS